LLMNSMDYIDAEFMLKYTYFDKVSVISYQYQLVYD